MPPRRHGKSSSSPSARELAVRVLRDVARTHGFSNRWLSHHLERTPQMDPRDRALCTTLTYGVLRHRERLDRHIDRHAHRPQGIRGELRDALRVAVFEMRELQRPSAIAVSEALKLVHVLDPAGRLRGVAQAILSGVDRDGEDLDRALASAAPIDALEGRWSIPRWLAGRWIKHLGAERALRRAEVLSLPPSIDLRLDTAHADPESILERLREEHPGAAIETVPDAPWSVRIRSAGDLFYGALHDEGLISVQGLAAQQAARLLDPQPGERVLDACAGMGVKTLQLAELMQRRGTIVAVDVDARQLAALDDVHRRGRLHGGALEIRVLEADLTADIPELDEAPFDRVLLDVPCTGLGNLARHPEIRWHRRFEDIAARVPLQRALLDRNWQRLRSGGTLVYAVCSAEPEEATGVLESMRNHPEGELLVERTWSPENDGTEGFYAAVWRRR